jgi:hypothetical protein
MEKPEQHKPAHIRVKDNLDNAFDHATKLGHVKERHPKLDARETSILH